MFRYITRRIFQMIPTVFGVIVITFILFNIVGGSPAAMTLGKNISPKALEEFDEQRGFNKPLLLGRWSATRAYEDATFARNAGSWRQVEGVTYTAPQRREPGHITLAPGKDYALPLAFKLKPQATYQWVLEYRLRSGAASFTTVDNCQAVLTNRGYTNLLWRPFERTVPTSQPDDVTGAKPSLAAVVGFERQIRFLTTNSAWQTVKIPFTAGADPATFKMTVHTEGGALEICTLKLRRQNANWFDTQFVFYLSQIARFDFGKSNFTNQRVSQMLKDGIGPSLCLTVPIFLVELVVAISIALLCAFLRNTFVDRLIVVIAVVLMSVNYLVWIIFGQYVLGYRWGWFPLWGFESWTFLLLPVLIGVVSGLGENVRFYRTIMLDEMYRDYVRTAFAKGVSRPGVLFKHVLKNGMIPISTNVVIAIPFLYTGSLLLESFFGIPGLGNMGINAVNYSDVDVIRAIVLIGSILYVVANLMTDLCYALFDPRVRLG
ncbi:MAG: ABC transporter permease subunit [Verrucomicrobia bacterium]|nr:ABC transporter permease subunit [Verrucomicrobiota bacterium]MBU1735137.1 ABC transporter permease subunit [Verrucomicrobiota bacterium]MBU1855994.1 ABC transporter permease subunit [Verrucomicrobiota bacterium]